MTKLVKIIDSKYVQIEEYRNPNISFNTNEYDDFENYCILRETFDPFEMFYTKYREIIEEDTKLKKINLNYSVPYAIDDMKVLRETLEEIIENQRIHEDRINELIDEVNKLKGEK